MCCLAQGSQNGFDMFVISGFQIDPQDAFVDVFAAAPVVVNAGDVAAAVGDDVGHWLCGMRT